jgi:CHAT domain-containing protein/tetratricopeptide (TPR) repeat protein
MAAVAKRKRSDSGSKSRRGSTLCVALSLILFVVCEPHSQVVLDGERSLDDLQRALDRGAYAEAEAGAARLCATLEAQHESESPELLRAQDLQVAALRLNGKAGAATTLALANRVVRLKENHLGPDDPGLASSLHNLGAVHVERGEFNDALKQHERALSIRLHAFAADDLGVADSLDYISLPLIRLQRFDEARRRLAQSQAIREGSLNRETRSFAGTLELVGLVERYSGNYVAARESIERALTMRRELSLYEHPETTSILLTQGDVLWLMGDIAGAQRSWADAVALSERTLPPTHPTIAFCLRKLGLAADAFGNIAEGRRLREQALQIEEPTLAPCHPEFSALLNDLAISLKRDGDYQAAAKSYERAFANCEKCLGPNDSLTATVVHNQATLAFEMGDLAAAEALEQRAVSIWSSSLGPSHSNVAFGLNSQAEIVASRGQYARARELYERALKIRRAVAPDNREVAWTLTKQASVIAELGEFSIAFRNIEQAIRIYQTGVSSQPGSLAQALALRGKLETRRGDYTAARASFAEVLSTRERIFGATHPLAAESRAELAAADFKIGSYDTALGEALEAERAGREHLQFTVRYLPERGAMAYALKRPKGLDLALSIVGAGHGPEPSAVAGAVIQSRGVILDELAARARSTAGSDPELATLNATLIAARQRFANLMLRSVQDGDSVRRELLDEARRQKEDAERAMAERSAVVRAELTRAHVGLDDIRHALPAHSALVSFVRYAKTAATAAKALTSPSRTVPAYLAFVIQSDSSTVAAIPLGSAASLETVVKAWRDEAAGQSIAAGLTPTEAESAYRTVGVRLRKRIWDPLLNHLGEASHVFVVPDGALNLVSFAALPTDDNRYLAEQSRVIHYLAAERDLITTETASTSHGLLAVGGPAFDAGKPPSRLANPRAQGQVPAAAGSTRTTRAGCGDWKSLRFEGLPGSQDEVRDIARIWPVARAQSVAEHEDALVLTGHAAGESAVKRAVAGRRVVHFATHGFFLGADCGVPVARTRAVGAIVPARSRDSTNLSDNPLLQVGLAFAGANNRTSIRSNQDDGILTGEEVAGLNLNATEWVVLSACDTGLGEMKAGEGVFGLRRAFQIAGARTVIMSLWSVDDQAVRVWMRALYQGRLQKHLSTADAMHQASLSVLRARRARGETTHPFYWAGFVAAGDWR